MNLTTKEQREKIKSIQKDNYIELKGNEEYLEILGIMRKARIDVSGEFSYTQLWSNFIFDIHNKDWRLEPDTKSLKKMSFEQFKELITVKDYEIY